MGFLKKLLGGGDPRRDLEKAEELLAKGEPTPALRLARRAAKSDSLAQQNAAEALIRRAEEALASLALEKSSVSEEAGFFDDAAEWLETALEHIAEEGRRQELERRVEELRQRGEEQALEKEAAKAAASFAALRPDAGDGAAPDLDIDADDHYEMLIGTLDADVAERYHERPAEFRQAFVDLNEGRASEALAALEALVESHPEDPVYRLERGRCRLILNQHEGAREDLEAVWETFGDEPLDLAATLSVPGLWAEAMLGLGEADALVERLDGVADPAECEPGLCSRYSLGLVAAERFEAARDYLAEAIQHHPKENDFSHQLAGVLHRLDRKDEAIAVLEQAIAPSCATGNCRRPPLHVPSARSLVGLHLDRHEKGGLARAGDLLPLIAQAQSGRLMPEDYLLLAEYHQQSGDEEAASEAAAEAKRLQEALAGQLERGAENRPSLGPSESIGSGLG